jgi:hypothetical protein
VISPTQRPLSDDTQYSQETNIHAPGGIRTYNPRKRAAVDLLLRPRATGIGEIVHFAYQKLYETKPFLDITMQEGRFEVENFV